MKPPRVTTDVGRSVLLTLLLVGLGQTELVSGDGRAAWWEYAIALLAALPVAICRWHPLIALVLSVVALTLLTSQGSSSFTVAQLLAMMIVTYALAARETRARAAAGLGLIVVAAFANSLAASDSEPGDYVFAAILLGVPWLAGQGMQMWRERAEELARLATELEATRAEHARLHVAAERGRIARDLHDSLAQTLNAVVVQSEAASAALGQDEQVVGRALEHIREVSRESLTETRALLGMLRGATSDEGTPGLPDLERLVERSRLDGAEVEMSVSGMRDRLGSAVSSATYRIVQESLTNATRHAPGRPITVTIECDDDVLVEVRNECADEPMANGARVGYGLVGMRERAHLAGGVLDAGRVGDTFVVRACLPTAART